MRIGFLIIMIFPLAWIAYLSLSDLNIEELAYKEAIYIIDYLGNIKYTQLYSQLTTLDLMAYSEYKFAINISSMLSQLEFRLLIMCEALPIIVVILIMSCYEAGFKKKVSSLGISVMSSGKLKANKGLLLFALILELIILFFPAPIHPIAYIAPFFIIIYFSSQSIKYSYQNI